MKSKKFMAVFFIVLGSLSLVLFFFGLQFNGTLSDEIQLTGLMGIGIFVAWGVISLVDVYLKHKELENL